MKVSQPFSRRLLGTLFVNVRMTGHLGIVEYGFLADTNENKAGSHMGQNEIFSDLRSTRGLTF